MCQCLRRLGAACTASPRAACARFTTWDVAVGSLVAVLGAAILTAIAVSTRSMDAAAAQALIAGEARDLSERIKLMFQPAVLLLRVAATAASQMTLDRDAWTRVGGQVVQVRPPA